MLAHYLLIPQKFLFPESARQAEQDDERQQDKLQNMHTKLLDRYHARRGKSIDVQVSLSIDKCLPPASAYHTGGRFVRITSTSQIGNDNSVTLRQLGHDIPPHIPGFSKTMQQYDRLTSPSRHIMQTYTIDFSRMMRKRPIELRPI